MLMCGRRWRPTPPYSAIKDTPYPGSHKESQDEAAVLTKALLHFKVDTALAGISGLYNVFTEVSEYMQRWRAHHGGG
jgi:hypothetical protein